jgi:hypothetical protein
MPTLPDTTGKAGHPLPTYLPTYLPSVLLYD